MRKSLLSLIFGISVLSLSAQIIPNGDFESTNANWEGINFVYNTTLKVPNHNGWDSKLGPVQGSQFLIISNTTTNEGGAHNKFACSFRPDTFSFHVGYFRLYSTEAFGIEVMLSKWNSTNNNRDTICFMHDTFPSPGGQIIPWTVVNRSLSIYYRNAQIPDSACISFFNDVINPVSSTTFMVLDECKWGYQDPSNKTFVDILDHEPTLSQVYYATGNLYFKYYNTATLNNSTVTVYNMNGQMVFTKYLNIKSDPYYEVFKLPELKNGIYIITIKSNTGLENKKFIVQ